MKYVDIRLVVLAMSFIAIFHACAPKNAASSGAVSQEPLTTPMGDFRMVTYNVENLFDVIDNPNTADEDFLPYGMNRWTEDRYNLKLKHIFKVLSNISEWDFPDVMCFTEIESREALNDLLERTPLSNGDFGIIHHESPDPRGIDVAFLYRRASLRPIQDEIIPIRFPFDSTARTRDILWVEALINKKDTIHFFLCHFPSRRGGETASEPRRNHVASVLRAKVDSIMQAQPNASIVISGDFNDMPDNGSMEDVLKAKGSVAAMQPGDLFNLMYQPYKNGQGTYKFQGYWNMLDQFIVTPAMLDTMNAIYVKPDGGKIFKPSWLEQPDDQGPGTKPFRTYSGPNYLGGYSDHFPIYMDIYFRKD
jgi:predicted extracellular nuclease